MEVLLYKRTATPFGQIPVLEVDGKLLAQSNAMARYLAREFDIAGKDNWEQALVDQYLELIGDMFVEMIAAFKENNEEKQKELCKNLSEVVVPKFFAMFEEALEKNGGKYLVGDSLTLADLALYNAFDSPVMRKPEIVEPFANIKSHRDMVEAIPALAEYVKTRTPSDI